MEDGATAAIEEEAAELSWVSNENELTQTQTRIITKAT